MEGEAEDERTLGERLAEIRRSNAVLARAASRASVAWRPRPAPQRAARRSHKDRPREISSKRPVPLGREGCLGIRSESGRKVGVDPRFAEHTGRVRMDAVVRDYDFVEGLSQREREELERESRKKPRDEDLKRRLRALDVAAKRRSDERRKADIRREAIESEREKVKEGKKPFFPSARVLRELELRSKFDELKRTGKLNKYIAKRRRKQAMKDKRLLPKS